MDPDTIRSLRSRIRMDLLPYCEGGSMIPVDLSANCEGWIYDPNGSGIQILGIRSRDPFGDPRTCLHRQTNSLNGDLRYRVCKKKCDDFRR